MASVCGLRIWRIHRLALSTNSCNCFSTQPPSAVTTISGVVNKLTKYLYEGKYSRIHDIGKLSFKQTVELISSSKPQRYFFSSSIKADLEDFRAREEKREAEFQEKQQEEFKQKGSTQTEQNIRTKILEAALPFVSTHGWSKKSLALGAEAAGYPSVAHGLFRDGGVELIYYFYGKCNDELVSYLKEKTKNGDQKVDKTVEFITDATKTRLQMLEPFIPVWPQAVAVMSLPQNVPTSLAQLLTLVDDICYYSGDRSVDFKWYIRRVGLAAIFKMTEVFMLQDSSVDHQETWRFLKRRMEEASYILEFFDQSEGLTHNMQKGFTSAFITARNIIGIDYGKR